MNRLIARVGFVTLLGALCLPAGIVSANMDHGKGKGHRVDKKVEHLTEKLGLNEQQAAQVRTILEAQKAELEQAWTASKEKSRQQINTVLTPDQQAKYAELVKKHAEKKAKWRDEHDDDDDDAKDDKTAPDKKDDTKPGTSQ